MERKQISDDFAHFAFPLITQEKEKPTLINRPPSVKRPHVSLLRT